MLNMFHHLVLMFILYLIIQNKLKAIELITISLVDKSKYFGNITQFQTIIMAECTLFFYFCIVFHQI